MRSSFFELNVALTGMMGARANLEVIGHNIANASTQGFSRQYSMQRASKPLSSNTGRGMIGTGVDIYGVGQVRDRYLDTKYWSEMPTFGEFGSKLSQLNMIERDFSALSESGLSAIFNSFFDRLQELSTNAGDATFRTSIIETGETLATSINDMAKKLQKQQTDINNEVRIVVHQINSLGQQISRLNEQISKAEFNGSSANDLRDQRALLIDELSSYVNIEVYENTLSNGKIELNILMNGQQFVTGNSVRELRLQERAYNTNPTDANGLYDIYFEGTNTKFDIYHPNLKGTLKGLIDIRDGNNSTYGRGSSTITPPGTITIDNMNRLDFSETGGKITIVDSSGRKHDFTYTTYAYDELTGTATFTIDPSTPIPASLSNSTDVRVGETNQYKGIPHYMNKLNELVRTIARAMNEGLDRDGNPIPGMTGHINGFDANGNNTGALFFSYDVNVTNGSMTNYEYNRFTANNFQINSLLISTPELLAAATTTDGISENLLIFEFIDIRNYTSLFKEGKIEDYIAGISSELGIDVKQSENFSLSYLELTLAINNQRISVSGVSIDEEVTNMIMNQQIYQAAAMLISVIDEIYDTTINRMAA